MRNPRWPSGLAQLREEHAVVVRASGGSIALLMPANAHGSIDAHTSGDRVDSAIPLSSTEIADPNERCAGSANRFVNK